MFVYQRVLPIEHGDIPASYACSSRHTQEADLEWLSLKQAGVVLSCFFFFWGGVLHEQTRKEYEELHAVPWGHPKFLKIFGNR